MYAFSPGCGTQGGTSPNTSAIGPGGTKMGGSNGASCMASSRALAGQELDVLAPGSWVRGPFPGDSGYSHLPWWSKSTSDLRNGHLSNFFYVGGTSMATPHVASIAALMLEKNSSLMQSDFESKLKLSALPMPTSGTQHIYDFDHFADIAWDTTCGADPCDPGGAGVVQANAALALVP